MRMTMNDFLEKVQTNVGEIEVIHVCNKNRPKDLKKPYEYVMDAHTYFVMYREFNDLIKPYEGTTKNKAITYGMFFGVFIFNNENENWKHICDLVQAKLRLFLGNDAVVYCDERQLTYEAYIMLRELS